MGADLSVARPVGEFFQRPLPAGAAPWLTYNRRIFAAVGVVGLIGLGFAETSDWSGRLALFTLLMLLTSTIVGWVEAAPRFRQGLPISASREHNPALPWTIAIAAVIVSCGCAAQTWFRVGTSIASGDIAPPDGTAWIGRLFTPWAWSGSNLGGVSQVQLRVPWAAVQGFVQLFGGSAALAQRVWYTALFTAAALACLALLAALGVSPVPSVVGSWIYVFSPYVVGIVYTNPVFFAAMALLAALLAAVLAASRARLRILTGAVLIGITAPMLGYVYQNPPLVGMIFGVVLISPLLAGWAFGEAAAKRCLRCIGLGIPCLLFLSSYWVVPAILSIGSAATHELASLTSWTWTEVRADLRNGFWLNPAWGWNFGEYYPFAGAYAQMPLSLVKFGLPALAFSTLMLRRIARTPQLAIAIAASTAALFLIFLSTGTNPPGSILFMPLYKLPFGWLLREPGRFLMLAGLAYSILVAVFLDLVVGSPRLNAIRLIPAVGAIAVAILVLVPGFPVFTGSIVPDKRPILPSAHVRMPAYWPEMAGFLDKMTKPGAVLILPPDDFYQMPYTWGYYGIDSFIPDLFNRPVLVPNGQGYTPASNQLLSSVNAVSTSLLMGDWQGAERVLNALHTPFILIRGDIQTPFPSRNIIRPATLDAALRKAPNFTLVHQAGALELFSLRTIPPPPKDMSSKSAVTLIQLATWSSAVAGAILLILLVSVGIAVKRRASHSPAPPA